MRGTARQNATFLMSIHIIFTLVLCCRADFDNENYCSLHYQEMCEGRGEHVACQYPKKGPGAACIGYKEVAMDNYLKQNILELINSLRQRVSAGVERGAGGRLLPRATHMIKVEWDDELAYLAQRLADQCIFQHDFCRATTRFPYAGQNLGLMQAPAEWGDGEDTQAHVIVQGVRRVLAKWARERRLVHARTLLRPFHIERDINGTIIIGGHYTQLVKATSSHIGCGVSRWAESIFLACDLSRSNVLGEPTYAELDPDVETSPQTKPSRIDINVNTISGSLSNKNNYVSVQDMLHTNQEQLSTGKRNFSTHSCCPLGYRLDTDQRFDRLCVPDTFLNQVSTETQNYENWQVVENVGRRRKTWTNIRVRPRPNEHPQTSELHSDHVAEQLYLDTGFRRKLRPERLLRHLAKTAMSQDVQTFTEHNTTLKNIHIPIDKDEGGVWRPIESYLQDNSSSSSTSTRTRSAIYLTLLPLTFLRYIFLNYKGHYNKFMFC